MKKVKFYYWQIIDATMTKSIVIAPIIAEFRGGVQVGGNQFPNGKCVAEENIIEFIKQK